MKKGYISPATSVQRIELQQMIANSPMSFSNNGESGEGQLIDGNASGSGLSRQSLWDDED